MIDWTRVEPEGDLPWGSCVGPDYWAPVPTGQPVQQATTEVGVGAPETVAAQPATPEPATPETKTPQSGVGQLGVVGSDGAGVGSSHASSAAASSATGSSATGSSTAGSSSTGSSGPAVSAGVFSTGELLARAQELCAQLSALVGGQVWEVQEDQLAPVVGVLDDVARLASAGIATVTAEAVERGVVGEKDTRAWVGAHAPGVRAAGAGCLATFLRETRQVGSLGRRAHLQPVRRAVLTGRVSLAEGRAMVTQLVRVTTRVADRPVVPILTEEELAGLSTLDAQARAARVQDAMQDADLLATLGRATTSSATGSTDSSTTTDGTTTDGTTTDGATTDGATTDGPTLADGVSLADGVTAGGDVASSGMTGVGLPSVWECVAARMLRVADQGSRVICQVAPSVLAELVPQVLEDQEVRARRHRALSAGRVAADGVSEYRLVLDPEAAMVLEASIGPLSAPRPVEGVPDLRCADQRRGDALLTLVQAAVAAPAGPGRAKTQLLLSMPLLDLLTGLGAGSALGGGRTGAASTLGGLDTGTLLSAGAARRLACDAELIPAVLGEVGEVLDLGRAKRLFTSGQLIALYHRDTGCTFGGCTTPARWCEAHHLVHWADGGPTDLTNAALLCQRHHTIVHGRRLHGTYDPEHNTVVWDTITGSYDSHLAGREPPRWHRGTTIPPDGTTRPPAPP